MIVDYRLLLAVSLTLPLFLFWLLPPVRTDKQNPEDNDDGLTCNYLAKIGPEFPCWDYLFGFLVNLVLTTYCKLLIGRPRPNFYAICQPTVVCEVDERRYVTDFNCTTDKFLGRNSLESFFSGHSSTGTYASLFIAMHLIAHWRVNYSIKALVCATVFGFGLMPGFTQVFLYISLLKLILKTLFKILQFLNHWHHWSDVLIGQIVGVLLGVAAFHMRHWFSNDDHHAKVDEVTEKSKKLFARD